MAAPILVKPIPAQIINEQAAYGPFDLKAFVQSSDPANPTVRFTAALSSGEALPQGMICTSDGILTGIPAKGTQGYYEIRLIAENAGGVFETTFSFTIKPSLLSSNAEYVEQLKVQVWQALQQNLPIPDLAELYDRPVTIFDIYYLLERWATLTIWDAFNLEPAGEKHLLHLEGASPHYEVFDRGTCLVAHPKDLFSHERTLADALQTARAMTREVYKRGWTIEMAGFEKMVRAVWVEAQHLGDKFGKHMDILQFDPTAQDYKVYRNESKERISAKLDRL